jgi:hypothetical protein
MSMSLEDRSACAHLHEPLGKDTPDPEKTILFPCAESQDLFKKEQMAPFEERGDAQRSGRSSICRTIPLSGAVFSWSSMRVVR